MKALTEGIDDGRPSDLLVVAAFAPELAGFDALLGTAGSGSGRVGGLLVHVAPVGIGLVAAASGAASMLEARRPRGVVLVGTCGAYVGSDLAIGDVVVARTTLLAEPAVLEGRADFPEPMRVRLDPHAGMTAALEKAGARALDVATTLAVTTDDVLAARLARHAGVEHLEAFAVATACAGRVVHFAAVLAVANFVGSRGRAEWRANHASAGRAASAYVARWIEAGAEGLPPA
jgi:nucleoside phosphorylase